MRQEIFNEIEKEREYQDLKWGTDFDDQNTINDWCNYITRYSSYASEMNISTEQQKRMLTKVATLAVAALEVLDRNGSFAKRHYDK